MKSIFSLGDMVVFSVLGALVGSFVTWWAWRVFGVLFS